MPIQVQRTLQGEVYQLYVLSKFQLDEKKEVVRIALQVYRSKGHFGDGFLPMIERRVEVANKQLLGIVSTLLHVDQQNYGVVLEFVEREAIKRIPFLQGGVWEAVNGTP